MQRIFSKKQPQPVPQQVNPQQQSAHAMNKMQLFAQKAEQTIDKKTAENELLRRKIIDLIKVGQKDNARKLLARKQKNEKMIEALHKRQAFMEKYMLQMEELQQNQEFMDTLNTANKVITKNRDNMEQMSDMLLDAKQMKQESEMARDELNDLIGADDEEDDDIAEMMKEYEDQVNDEMKKNLDQHDKKLLDQTKGKPAQQQQTQPTKKSKEEDIDELMKELLS